MVGIITCSSLLFVLVVTAVVLYVVTERDFRRNK
jgi:hypothetical protein